jgi:hypothetical protein
MNMGDFAFGFGLGILFVNAVLGLVKLLNERE